MDRPKSIEAYKYVIMRYLRGTMGDSGAPLYNRTTEEFWKEAYELNLDPESFLKERRKCFSLKNNVHEYTSQSLMTKSLALRI